MGSFAAKVEENVSRILKKHFDEVHWVDQMERVLMAGSVHCLTRGVPINVPEHLLPCDPSS